MPLKSRYSPCDNIVLSFPRKIKKLHICFALQLCYGGKVPESFYKKKEDFFATEKETVVETIGRNGKLEISKDIKVAGSLLRYGHVQDNLLSTCHLKYDVCHSILARWMFATDSGTVNFSVLRETEKSKPEGKQKKAAAATEVLLCRKEVECHRVPEDGTLVCPHVGTCKSQSHNGRKI